MGKPRLESQTDPLADALRRALATETDPQVRKWIEAFLAGDGAAPLERLVIGKHGGTGQRAGATPRRART